MKTLVLLSAGLIASTMLAQPGESSPAPAENVWLAAKPVDVAPTCPCGTVCECDELRSEIAALKVQLASLQVAKPVAVKEVALRGGCANGSCGTAGPVRSWFQNRPRIFGRFR